MQLSQAHHCSVRGAPGQCAQAAKGGAAADDGTSRARGAHTSELSSALPGAPAGQLPGREQPGTPWPRDIPAGVTGCSLHGFKSVYCHQHSHLVYSPLSAMLGVGLLLSRSSSVSAPSSDPCFPHSVFPADCSPDSDSMDGTERAIKVAANLDHGKRKVNLLRTTIARV